MLKKSFLEATGVYEIINFFRCTPSLMSEFTVYQERAYQDGATYMQAKCHDWTFEQVLALEYGATVEQAMGHDWTFVTVEDFRDCMKQEDKTAAECVNEIFPESVEVAADALGQDALQVDGQQ